MKYTKKQITQAFEAWTIESRLTPSVIMSDKDVAEIDVNEMARLSAECLIDYINQ